MTLSKARFFSWLVFDFLKRDSSPQDSRAYFVAVLQKTNVPIILHVFGVSLKKKKNYCVCFMPNFQESALSLVHILAKKESRTYEF